MSQLVEKAINIFVTIIWVVKIDITGISKQPEKDDTQPNGIIRLLKSSSLVFSSVLDYLFDKPRIWW